jgi:asparagine synthase (glutamine-hydrolysing)
MCGIAGFTNFYRTMGDTSTLVKMGEVMAYRGPDAHGEYTDSLVGLCHRRLSIIDLSAAGNQPMYSADGNLVVVFNGEIYNFLELRKTLADKGYPFKSHTDTEVILALYQSEGEHFVEKICGMFAIAIWDKRERTLFLVRDRIGKKPLYYYSDGKDFAFASEIKALLQIPSIPKTVRLDAIHDFFAYQYIPDPKTIFRNIYKLEPGHWLKVSDKGITTEQYWDISFANISSKSEQEIREELLHLIEQATRQRMISDVPLGAFLSGGVDSSGIVAVMSLLNDTPVTTCSIGFDEERFNETEFAEIVARQYHTRHHEYHLHDSVADQLSHIAGYFDEPFADPSLVPTYFVSSLAKRAVTVALAGDGGDEIFAGYEKYSQDGRENAIKRWIPGALRGALFPALANRLQQSQLLSLRRSGSLLQSLSVDPAMGFYISNSQISDAIWQQLASRDLQQQLGDYHPSHITKAVYQRADTEDHLARILYTDMKTYLPGDILVKVDRMSMANSLEVRAPLLDHRVIEYAARIPSSLKLRRGEKKYILKECFKPLLPHDILYRKKMGFSVPLASWLRGEIRKNFESLVLGGTALDSGYFSKPAAQRLWQEHLSERRDHSAPLWSLLMFCLWHKKYIES